MITAKYKLFSAEPKASKFPRYAHRGSGRTRHFDLGRHAISPGSSATESYPASTAGLVLRTGLWNVIERFAMSIVGFLRDRQADILVGKEALPS